MRTNGIWKDAGFLIGPSQVLCVDVLLLIPAFGSRVVTTIQCVRVEKCRVHRLWGLSGLSLRVCACVLSCCGHVQLLTPPCPPPIFPYREKMRCRVVEVMEMAQRPTAKWQAGWGPGLWVRPWTSASPPWKVSRGHGCGNPLQYSS